MFVQRIKICACIAVTIVLCTACHNSKIVEDTEKSEVTEMLIDTETLNDIEILDDTEVLQDTEMESDEPEYTYCDRTETMYVTADVNVRSGPSIQFGKIGGLKKAEEVEVTGSCNETGWYRVNYKNGVGYVSNNYLSVQKPEQQPVEEEHLNYQDTGDAELNRMCDDILSDIVDKNMTERERAYAVYTWVTEHVKYRGTTATDDWVAGAKKTLSTYKGNCYAFYSASRALLTRLGVENAEAVAIKKDHYWNLVKVDGEWWHFDTTSGWGTERFLWTSDQINNYRYYNPQFGRYIEYEWDQQGIPE